MRNKLIIITLLALTLISLSFYLLEKEKLEALKNEIKQQALKDQEATLFSSNPSYLESRIKRLEYQMQSLEYRIGPKCTLTPEDTNLTKI